METTGITHLTNWSMYDPSIWKQLTSKDLTLGGLQEEAILICPKTVLISQTRAVSAYLLGR